ncbi:aminotransferase class IV family protein [Hydrogenimonas sp. SS33]|uniref:aminotransferase class IV family protein n=1 Tax=Hydrogenimonas leucolamina TaxID=2954236 RepID=UPI00336BED6A
MLLETICIHNGAIQNLSLHQARLNRSQAALFDDYEAIDLGRFIHPPSGSGTLKCRVTYGRELFDVVFEPYRPRAVRHLKPMEARIDYAHKYSDREALDDLFAQRGEADDILILRNGYVTDTSVANIAFLKEGRWYTPRLPLLRGTTRERLVRSGFLTPRDIRIEEVDQFEAFALLNAMIGFLPVKNGRIG